MLSLLSFDLFKVRIECLCLKAISDDKRTPILFHSLYIHRMLYSNLEIRSEDLPNVLQAEFNGHPKRYRTMRLLMMSFLMLIFSAGPIGAWFEGETIPAIVITSIWALIFVWFLIVEFRSFPLRGYLIREKDISYKKGWIFRSMVTVPYNRIQHSEISQGPLSRMMKLSTLNIFTAGGSSSDLSIHGLKPDEAERLREFVTEKIAAHV